MTTPETTERFVIAPVNGETRVARVQGRIEGEAFVFEGGSVALNNVFGTELAASEELLKRMKAILALLEG